MVDYPAPVHAFHQYPDGIPRQFQKLLYLGHGAHLVKVVGGRVVGGGILLADQEDGWSFTMASSSALMDLSLPTSK